MEGSVPTVVVPDLPPPAIDQQLEQLDAAVQQIQRVRAQLEESEAQFRRVTERCGGALEALVRLDEQNVSMVAALNARLNRLVEDSAERLQRFERGVGHEWTVLREMYEQPLGAIRQQASEFRTTCLEVARSASLTSRIAEESFAQFAGANAGTISGQDVRPASTPWSLSEVAQLHHQMRRSTDRVAGVARTADPGDFVRPAEAESPATVDRSRRSRFMWRTAAWWIAAIVALLLVSGGLAAYAVTLRDRIGRLEAQTVDAARRITVAETRAVETLRSSEAQVAQAAEAARNAAIVSDILAAPDMRRIDLLGTARAPTAFAQAMWSRSRGCIVSASGLPTPQPGREYYVWALSATAPTSLGALRHDGPGRARLLVDTPLRFSGLTGLVVTDEPAGRPVRPSAAIVLQTLR